MNNNAVRERIDENWGKELPLIEVYPLRICGVEQVSNELVHGL